MSRIDPATLTDHQRAQLVLLARFSALSRRGGLDVHRAPDLNAVTMSKLLRMGLTCSAPLAAGAPGNAMGGQKTVYWLTEEGAQIAAGLRRQAAQQGGGGQ